MRVILVHGYLAPASLLSPLAWRLARSGFEPEIFDYPSRRPPFERHADALFDFVEQGARPFGLVGHSMGGLLLHAVSSRSEPAHAAAQVFVATPHAGSRWVRTFAIVPLLSGLVTAIRPSARGVGRPSAGGKRGSLAARFDYMVARDEGRLPGADDHLELPYGHNDILLRARSAALIARFLNAGHF